MEEDIEHYKNDIIKRKLNYTQLQEEYKYNIAKMEAANILHEIELANYYHRLAGFIGIRMLTHIFYLK